MAEKSYYDILGVEPEASRDEIRLAWQRLIRKYHPDIGENGGDPQKFTAVQKAYSTLEKESSRAAYDRSISASKPSYTPGPSTKASAPRRTSPNVSPYKRASKPKPSAQYVGRTVVPPTPVPAPAPKPRVGWAPAPPTPVPQAPQASTPTAAWKKSIPDNVEVRYVPTTATKWSPVAILAIAAACPMMGLFTVYQRAPHTSLLETVAVPLLWGTLALMLVAFMYSLAVRKQAKPVVIPAAVGTALLVVGLAAATSSAAPHALALAVLFSVFWVGLSVAVHAAIPSPETDIPQQLARASMKDVKEFDVWGTRKTQQFTTQSQLFAMESTDATVQELASVLKNLKIAKDVITPVADPKEAAMLVDVATDWTQLVAVCGTRVALINTLVFPPGTIRVLPNKTLQAGATATPVTIQGFLDAAEAWQKHLGRSAIVKPFVVFATSGSSETELEFNDYITMVKDSEVEDTVGEFLSKNYDTVDYRILSRILPYASELPDQEPERVMTPEEYLA